MKSGSKPTYTAVWSCSLIAECPACKETVDLLEYPDFWDGRSLDFIEHDTERSRDIEVICPDYGHEFQVDLEW